MSEEAWVPLGMKNHFGIKSICQTCCPLRWELNYISPDDNSWQLRPILTQAGLLHMLSNWNLKQQSWAKMRGIIREGVSECSGVSLYQSAWSQLNKTITCCSSYTILHHRKGISITFLKWCSVLKPDHFLDLNINVNNVSVLLPLNIRLILLMHSGLHFGKLSSAVEPRNKSVSWFWSSITSLENNADTALRCGSCRKKKQVKTHPQQGATEGFQQ